MSKIRRRSLIFRRPMAIRSYFGKMPEKFTWKGKEYTPHSFAESLPIKMSDYVFVTSYTHHPFYTQYIVEVPDN